MSRSDLRRLCLIGVVFGLGFDWTSAMASALGSSRTTDGCLCKVLVARGELGLLEAIVLGEGLVEASEEPLDG